MQPTIVFEDNHLLVINKPFGMPSQKDETKDLSAVEWVEEYLRTTYQKEGNVYVALLHRLDRPTGGLLMFAKTSKAAARMSADFQQNKIQKTYCAVTENTPSNEVGELQHYLAKLPAKNIVKAYQKAVYGAKLAVLSYKVLATHHQKALVEIYPKTGRQHQIRVQLASIGCVICGDVKYGKTNFLSNKCICLMATSLTFTHPIKKEALTLQISLPKETPWADFAH
ncbi:MAG: RluA family pseudouridine synthase [Bacteroidia bacterium]